VLGIGAANDRHDAGRVAQQPRQRDGGRAALLLHGHGVQCVAHGLFLRMVDFAERDRCLAAELALRERTPRERRDAVPLVVVERPVLKHVVVEQADLNLVADQLHRARRLQMVELIHGEIAHAELAHFAGLFQLIERFGDFFLLHKVVRPVQQVQVDAVDVHALERRFARVDDVVSREVVAVR